MILEEQFPVPRNTSVSKIGNSVISLLWQLRCHCNPDHNKFSSLSNTTVVAIFPKLCLWRRRLCSNLGGIGLEKLYRATLSKNKKSSILRVIHETEANSVINKCKHAYIHAHNHIYIWKAQMRLTLGRVNPGWSRMQPDLVCCKWLGRNESEHTFMITE